MPADPGRSSNRCDSRRTSWCAPRRRDLHGSLVASSWRWRLRVDELGGCGFETPRFAQLGRTVLPRDALQMRIGIERARPDLVERLDVARTQIDAVEDADDD